MPKSHLLRTEMKWILCVQAFVESVKEKAATIVRVASGRLQFAASEDNDGQGSQFRPCSFEG
jgi:hypothetical protein